MTTIITITAAKIASGIQSAIALALFGRPGLATRRQHDDDFGIEHVAALSQRFKQAAPMGGGAILAVQAMAMQPVPCRSRSHW